MEERLPSHQLESGLVTTGEVRLAQRWAAAVTVDGQTATNPLFLDDWLGVSLPFSFSYGGQPSASFLDQWTREADDKRSDSVSELQRIAWTDPASGLRVTWEMKRFLEFPAVEWVLRFENQGSQNTPIIENVQALDLRLKRSGDEPYRVHGAMGGRSQPDDFRPFSYCNSPNIELGCTEPCGATQSPTRGEWPSSNRHLPFYNVETPPHGGVMVGIGWSGMWQARTSIEDGDLWTRAGQKHLHLALRPGEAIRSPRILLLIWEGKRLHGHNMFRQLLHRHYVPCLLGKPQEPLVSTNTAFHDRQAGSFLAQATEKAVRPLIEPFVKLGVELFIIDAGWYEGDDYNKYMGDWKLAKSKYPRGLRPISEPLAAAHVAFGLWFAPEVATPNSVAAREHPEWVRKNLHLGHHDALRLELPEAREWFLQQVRYLADHEGMTCYRQDFGGFYGDEPDDRKGFTENQHTSGLYAVWDAIVRQYPQMIMEGCCGGGRRIDLETLSRFHWHQMSDRFFSTEEDQCSLYGANLFLPGGLLIVFTETEDDYTAWTSFAGQFCMGWPVLEAHFHREQAKLQVERYKRIRGLLGGDFYPLTPYALDAPWLGYQFHRADLDRGFALVFHRLASKGALLPDTDALPCSLRGVAPEGRYRVHFERSGQEEILTGEELTKGVAITLPELRTAEMITYEAS